MESCYIEISISLTSWANARASAFEALTRYEVPHILQFIPDFREKNIDVLVSEIDSKVLEALERFEAKMITHKHTTRRRVVKEKRVPANKIEKLLDVFPRVSVSFRVLHDLHAKYEMALMEIAASLQLSRNMTVALLSLQSWKPILQRWLHACIKLLDIKAPTSVLDTTSKAAADILKALPPSAHATKVSALKFLLSWLFQHEHEYRQWSAAISPGVISSCIHVTDHKQKFQNINALLEVACTSKSTLVRGACGLALGYLCQDLLTHFQPGDNSYWDKELHEIQETDLLGKIIRSICRLIDQHTVSSTTTLEALSEYLPQLPNTTDPDITSSFLNRSSDNLEDMWGVAGLVIGLGSSVTAVYRS